MPIFNAAVTLPRAIGSLCCIAAPDRQRVHLIGVNDGSTDESGEIFVRAAANVEGLHWSLLSRMNGGSGAARNEALRSFSSGWTLCLDADDELIEDPFPFLDKVSGATALLFDTDFYRGEKSFIRRKAYRPNVKSLPEMFSALNPYPTLSIIFRRELVDNLFAEDLRYLEDWYFLATNPEIFTDCVLHFGTAIGRVHAGKKSKSADQYKNGYYRVVVADRLAKYWDEERSLVVKNNLVIQQAIGKIQMGEPAPMKTLMCLPAAMSLYVKLWIYMFAYRLYLRFYPYT